MQLAGQRFVDLAAGEVKARQITIGREPRSLELIGHRSDLAFGGFGFQQLGEDRNGGFKGRCSLLHEISDSLGHAVHFQAAEHDNDGAAGDAWRVSRRSAS